VTVSGAACRQACADARSPAELFVALVIGAQQHLVTAENAIGPTAKFALAPADVRVGPPVIDQLRDALDEVDPATPEFWVAALRAIKLLDLVIPPDLVPDEAVHAYGRAFLLRARNCFFADLSDERFGTATGTRTQGRTMLLYARNLIVVPVDFGASVGIEATLVEPTPPRATGARVGAALALRARQRRGHVLTACLPYELRWAKGSAATDGSARLHHPSNDEEIVAAALHALERARAHDAAILVFPELGMPPAGLRRIVASLADHSDDEEASGPEIVVVGMCHEDHPDPAVAMPVNQAVILASDGVELFRHLKLTAFSYPGATGHRISEATFVGTVLNVLPTRLGNLAAPICLDLFHTEITPALARSHATLLCVPSLSPSLSLHESAAKQLRAASLATTFVANRTLDGSPDPDAHYRHVVSAAGEVGETVELELGLYLFRQSG